MLKMKVGVRTHETLDKVLTETVSSLRVDPLLDRAVVLTGRLRTGQEIDLQDLTKSLVRDTVKFVNLVELLVFSLTRNRYTFNSFGGYNNR